MTVRIYHAFQSAKPDGGDSTLVRASDWNADHALSMATARLLGRASPDRGDAQELAVYPAARLAAGALDVSKRTGSLLAHDVFTSNGTWSKHADAALILVQVIGGGAGANTGGSQASGTAPVGGGSGGPGYVAMAWFIPSWLGSTESVVVGAQVNGGVGPTNGGNQIGTRGNKSSFGNHIIVPGGEYNANRIVNGVTFWQGEIDRFPTSAYPDAGGLPWMPFMPAGGGWGGSLTAGNAIAGDVQAGGAGYGGGFSNFEYHNTARFMGNGGAAGSTAGQNGTAGTSRTGTSAWFGCGDGGGGGQSSGSGAGGAGGDGGAPGGGGGGGGACLNSFKAGDGGKGARGEVRVLQWG